MPDDDKTLTPVPPKTSATDGGASADAQFHNMSELPPPVQKMAFEMMTMSGPTPRGPDRLLSKIPEDKAYDALTKILETSEKKVTSDNQVHLAAVKAQDSQNVRRAWLVAYGLSVIAIIIVTCIVLDKDDLAKTLVPLLSGLVAGGIGGYGLGKASS